MPDEAVPVVPIYLALDQSSAEAIRHYPAGLLKLRDRFGRDAGAQQGVKVQVVTVEADRCAMSRWFDSDELQVPSMTPRGAGFGAAALFRMMRTSLEGDLAYLKRGGFRVHRPLLFLLAATAPATPWQDEFRSLTDYDGATRTGFKLYPLIIPVSLSDAADRQLSSSAFPPDQCEGYVTSNPDDLAASVTAAFSLISDVVSSLWSNVLEGRTATGKLTPPAGIRRSIDPPVVRSTPDHDPARGHETVPKTSYATEPVVATPAPERVQVAYLQLRCMRTGESTWNRFENDGTAWLIEQSSVDTSNTLQQAVKDLSGTFDIAPEFTGCARCGNRSYFRCDCGQVSCWDATTRSCPCHWCHRTVYISRTMTSAQAVD
jgi:hypothetical protein